MCITEMSRWPWVPLKSIRGSEWGHLDNTKHLIFWLKQLNFGHFNTNRKKFTVTVNFSQKETKTAPKRPILFCLVYQEVFSHFPTIPDHFGRFPKTTEVFRRLPKISKEKSENPVLPRLPRMLLRMGRKKRLQPL